MEGDSTTQDTHQTPVLQEEDTSPADRFSKTDIVAENIYDSINKRVYPALDNESCTDVCWVEYVNVPASALTNFDEKLALLKSISHPNVIRYLDGWVDRKKNSVVFITELLTQNLRRLLRKKMPLKSSVFVGWVQKLISGLTHLHSLEPSFVHGDLKGSNIYIRSANGEVKIGGLELALLTNKVHPTDIDITRAQAPEAAEGRITAASDVYALGLVALELFTSDTAYAECTTMTQLVKKQLVGHLPKSVKKIQDKNVLGFVTKALEASEEGRPSLDDLSKILSGDMPWSVDATPDNSPPPSPRPSKSRRRDNRGKEEPEQLADAHSEESDGYYDDDHGDWSSPDEPRTRSRRHSRAHGAPLRRRRGNRRKGSIKCYFAGLQPVPYNVQTASDSSNVLIGDTLVAFDPPLECVRVYYDAKDDLKDLLAQLADDFAYLLPERDHLIQLKYWDEEGELVTLTRHSHISELLEHASKLFVTCRLKRVTHDFVTGDEVVFNDEKYFIEVDGRDGYHCRLYANQQDVGASGGKQVPIARVQRVTSDVMEDFSLQDQVHSSDSK